MKKLNKMDYKSFYKDVAKRQGWSFKDMKYTKIKNSEFDYYEFISKHLKSKDIVLDIGCGDCHKSVKFFKAKKVICSDIEQEMLNKAQENIIAAKKEKIFETMLLNKDKKYPFEKETFDFVISRHCGVNTKEMYRVLKKNGIFVSEDIDKNDCLELKLMFGRGQGFDEVKNVSDDLYEEYQKLKFSEIKYFPIREVEYYETPEDLLYLLENTPIIPNFNKDKNDMKIFKEYCQKHTTKLGIRLDRQLYAFILIK